jgi:hypothetical protein
VTCAGSGACLFVKNVVFMCNTLGAIMNILSLLVVSIVGLFLRGRYVWGFSSSSMELKLQQQHAFPIDNHLVKLRCSFAPKAVTATTSLAHVYNIDGIRLNGIRSAVTAATRFEEAVGATHNSKFAYMNVLISPQRPAIVDIRMKGNISDPSDSDDRNSFAKSDDTQSLYSSSTVNAANVTDDNLGNVRPARSTDASTISNDGADIGNDRCDDILGYLGGSVSIMPPQTQDLLRRVTYNYIYGTNEDIVTLQEIASIIEEEHRSRDVPVQF